MQLYTPLQQEQASDSCWRFYILVFITFACPGTLSATPETLTFSTLEMNNEPVYPRSDPVTQILIKAYQQLGIDIEIRGMPGLRSLESAARGDVDGELLRGAEETAKYQTLLQVPVPIYYLDMSLISWRPITSINTEEDLAPYSVSHIRGGIIGAEIASHARHQITINSFEQVLRLVKSRRVDIGIINALSLQLHLKGKDNWDLHIINPLIRRVPMYHFLHQKHKSLIEPLTQALRQITSHCPIEGRLSCKLNAPVQKSARP